RDRRILFPIALVIVAVAALWAASTQITAPPEPQPADPGAPAAVAASGTVAGPTTIAIDRVAADTADVPTSPAPIAADPTVTVRGRCVTGDDHEPLAGCLATVRVEAGSGAATTTWSEATAAARVTTIADGTFELTATHDAWLDSVALRLEANGFVPRIGRWLRPAPGAVIELGDVPMAAAIEVHGTIVDEAGVAVADAGLMFVHIAMTGGHEVAAENMLRARSDATGNFTFAVPAYPGEWYVGAEDTGALVEPRSVVIAAEQSPYSLRIVVERPDPSFSITGRVVDEDDRPMSGVRITATGEGFVGRGRSGDDGRFVVQRAGPVHDDGKPGTLLSCTSADNDHERVRPETGHRIPWGAHDVEVVMRPLAAQSVRVIDAQGRAVTDYALFLFRGHEKLSRHARAARRGPHADGRCRLTGLGSGSYSVVIAPRAPTLASTAAIPFVIEAGVAARELTVAVEERVPLRVSVSGADGQPQVASTVEVLQSLGGEPPTAAAAAVAIADCDRPRSTPEHAIVAAAATDAAGIAELAAPPGNWTLRVRGDDHVPLVQTVQVAAPATAVAVTVQAAAVLRASLQPDGARAALQTLAEGGDEPIAIVLRPAGGEALPAVAFTTAGECEAGGLPPGDYDVSLRYWLHSSDVHARSITSPVASVALAGGQPRELDIDVSALLPATVHGRVIAGGAPLAEVHCFLRRIDPGPILAIRVATDRDGHFTGLVPPGRYGFAITYPAQPGPGWLHIVLPEEWDLATGESREQNFDVLLRRIGVQVLDADDRPVADLRLEVKRKGYFLPGGLKTAADGRIEIYPAPFDAFELDAVVDGRHQRLGPIDLPPGQDRGDVVVRMPR
ncbi:MAG: hypothetical protein KDC98_03245, partial [Planctomycetes bacterium]|nr:hypothetical protein [Planctomycetota bacterium]